MPVPAGYVELGQRDHLPDLESQAIVAHYRANGCTIYKASAQQARGQKNADFIIVCHGEDGDCVAIIEVKSGKNDCKDAVDQIKGSVNAAQGAGLVNGGQNAGVSLTVFNPTNDMVDSRSLDQDIDVGSAKKRITLVKDPSRLPC